jgi:hypothetical protein
MTLGELLEGVLEASDADAEDGEFLNGTTDIGGPSRIRKGRLCRRHVTGEVTTRKGVKFYVKKCTDGKGGIQVRVSSWWNVGVARHPSRANTQVFG